MKWNKTRGFGWFFALFPVRCRACHDWFWLERGITRRDSEGSAYNYCKDCAPHWWDGAKEESRE